MALNIGKTFGTDEDKETNGTWIDIGDGAKIKIARIGNPNYNKVLNRLTKPHRRSFRTGTVPEEVAAQLLTKALAEAILLDWEGIVDNDEKPISYSKENAYKLLDTYRDFRDQVSGYADELETFKAEEDSEGKENIKKSSNGKTSTEKTKSGS